VEWPLLETKLVWLRFGLCEEKVGIPERDAWPKYSKTLALGRTEYTLFEVLQKAVAGLFKGAENSKLGGWATRWERLRAFAIEQPPELSENLELRARISTKSY
jgi:hypothetical protein